ncbi:MAG: dipeptidase, partial [Myxococcota bacterium]
FWFLFGRIGEGVHMRGEEIEELKLLERAKALLGTVTLVDGHIDLPWRLSLALEQGRQPENPAARTSTGDFDAIRAIEGRLDAAFMAIYVPAAFQQGGAKAKADALIDMVEALIRANPERFRHAYSPRDIDGAHRAGQVALPMGIENGAALEDDLGNVAHFARRGIRYITLCHSKDNQLCDSSYDTRRTHEGLSPFGTQVIQEMNRHGIMVDLSHVSDATALQVLEQSQVPPIASHSSARHFTPDWERNMSDALIEALAARDGVIMVNFGSGFLCEAVRRRERKFASVETVADHIDHIKGLVGVEHVGIGSDFDGVGDTLPEGLKDVSHYPNLFAELLRRGYSEDELRRIASENLFRVWNTATEFAFRE